MVLLLLGVLEIQWPPDAARRRFARWRGALLRADL